MLPLRPFHSALTYVPLRTLGSRVQTFARLLRVRYVPQREQSLATFEDNFEEEQQFDNENTEIELFDLSRKGYIGLPRAFAVKRCPDIRFLDITVKKRRQPDLIPRTIKPRDAAQRQFFARLQTTVLGPKPVDIIANATTGAGKTIAILWLHQNVIQAPILIMVPTNYLKNQWVKRIEQNYGIPWCKKYLGIIQQDKMDYEGRLISVGLLPSLARRNYPIALRRYFPVIVMDEGHHVGAPSAQAVLAKYPASVRINLTATNRQDALKKVIDYHLGTVRIISHQEVMKPLVYKITNNIVKPENMELYSDFHVISYLARLRARNLILLRILNEYGYARGRRVVGMSDRVDQLQRLRMELIEQGVPAEEIGLIVGRYKTGEWRTNRRGERVPVYYKPKQEDDEHVANNCSIILVTYGKFGEGSDIDDLDMGVELTPRGNVRQYMGRVLRIKEGKAVPEWYTIDDHIFVRDFVGAFSDPNDGTEVACLVEMANARAKSFKDQKTVAVHALVLD